MGGPCHGEVVELPLHQDIYRPTSELRPQYTKLYQSTDKLYAYFACSDLSNLEANELAMEHIRARRPAKVLHPPGATAAPPADGRIVKT